MAWLETCISTAVAAPRPGQARGALDDSGFQGQVTFRSGSAWHHTRPPDWGVKEDGFMESRGMSRIVAAGVACLVTLSACTTLDPYTREERTAPAQRQAVIGAAVGGAVGLITGDSSMERKKRALIGAGL